VNLRTLRLHQKLIISVFLVALANAFSAYLLHSGNPLLHKVETYFEDLLMLNSSQTVDPQIVVVAIDDQSLKDFGRLGQWDRAIYAQLIANLKDAGAKVAAFDIAFIDPTPRDPIVAQAIQYAQSSANGSTPMPVILAVVGDGNQGRVPGQGLAYDQFLAVTPAIRAGQPQLANVTVDPDGAEVRDLPLRAISGNEHYWLLPFAAVNAYLGRPPLDQITSLTPAGIKWDDRLVPTDSAYRMLINFEGRPASFKHFSLSSVVRGQVPAEELKGKLVFVGELGATSLADNYIVPTSNGTNKMDGVEIWAMGAQNMLDGKYVTAQDEVTTILVMLVLSSLAAAGFFLGGAVGWASTIALEIVSSGVAYLWTIQRLNSARDAAQVITLPNIAYVNVDILLGSLVLFSYLFIQEQRSRRAINQMFGKYLTPSVAKHVMELQEQGELGLGGSLKDATIMFGDIRGFTTLSEGMEPEEVMGMLNRYFDGMVEIIMKHGGTISKFIGDNVMVLFNLPVPLDGNHALPAVRAGFEIQEWIRDYRAAHPEERAAFGFGISSGELVAGNMGSEERMEYTVIGDPVREADELCATAAANEVAISESTYERIKDSGVEVEDKGLVTIKGKTEQIHMFTITGLGVHASLQPARS